MISFDTNIVVHSANEDSPCHRQARDFLCEMGKRNDVILCELMLVQVFLKLCNAKIFECPMVSSEAGHYCQRFRESRNWRIVESAPVMNEVWNQMQIKGTAFRRIIDFRLGLTLRHFGVNEFATTNVKDFPSLGFQKVWNPLANESP